MPDANTVAILLAINSADVAYARIATIRASHRDVKAFARRMNAEHATFNSTLNQLASRHQLTPREDEVSRLLRDHSSARRDSLRALSGRSFDSAYVANEVHFHRELLIAIERALLSSARQPALREYIATLRPALSAHLAHAQQLQAAILAQK
jgi:putative membrane protein